MNYVIIGNSTAAVGCIEGIREVDKDSAITVISSEPYHTYSRPLISYLLYGKTTEELMKYRPDDFYEKNGVTTLLGETVVKIDPQKKCVSLDSGKEISYDKLLTATGSKPFIPPFSGLDKIEKKFTFMSLDDAKALDQVLTKESKVLVVGAGLIGLKCVEGILDKVASLTVTDLADRILPSILDSDASAMVQRFLEKRGVKFLLNNSVSEFFAHSAKMKNGEIVSYDAVVLAVGVRPNTELIKDAGGEVNRGIVIDTTCKTSLPDIYCAGDCSEGFDSTIDGNRILALLPNAYMQGHCAGVNMAGGKETFDNAIPMNAIGFFGMHIITAGTYDGEIYADIDENKYKKLFYKDGLLRGYILIGDVANAGIYTSLIRNKTPLDMIDFDLIKEKPQLMAFTKAERAKALSRPH